MVGFAVKNVSRTIHVESVLSSKKITNTRMRQHSLEGQWRSFATMTAISTNIEAWVLAADML